MPAFAGGLNPSAVGNPSSVPHALAVFLSHATPLRALYGCEHVRAILPAPSIGDKQLGSAREGGARLLRFSNGAWVFTYGATRER